MSPKPILKDKLCFNFYLLHLPCGKRFIIVKANYYFWDYSQTHHRHSKAQTAPLPRSKMLNDFWPWQRTRAPRRQLYLRLPQPAHSTGSRILVLLWVTFSYAGSIFLGKAEAEGLNPPLRGRASFLSCKVLWERQDRCNRASDLQVPEGRSVPAPGSRQHISCFTKLPREALQHKRSPFKEKTQPKPSPFL